MPPFFSSKASASFWPNAGRSGSSYSSPPPSSPAKSSTSPNSSIGLTSLCCSSTPPAPSTFFGGLKLVSTRPNPIVSEAGKRDNCNVMFLKKVDEKQLSTIRHGKNKILSNDHSAKIQPNR